MIPLERYTELLRREDIRELFAASLVGRLPIGITGLAVLIFVQTTSGSFAAGGAATACYVGGLALVAPLVGRLIDRYGPRAILRATAILFPAALIALVFTAGRSWAMTLSLAVAAGASFPPITVCMRAYFRQRLADDVPLTTAYSLESVLIEMIFIVGPMLVALFVAFGSAAAAVCFAGACGSLGAMLFLRSSALRAWRIEKRSAVRLLGPLTERGFLPLVGVVLCFSTAFGLLEIGVTAYATQAGAPAVAGLLLGLMSVGSALGGLAYGSRSWRLALVRQFALMLAVMGAGLLILALARQPIVFAMLSLMAGVVMAPALIIQSMLVAKAVRPEHSAEAFTWSASALLAGVGLGLAGGGALLDVFSSSAALTAAGASAMGAALLARFTLGRLGK